MNIRIHWPPNRGTIFGFLWMAVLVAASQAQISHEILAVAVTNYTGFVVTADGRTNNAAYNRESLLVDSEVRVGNSGTRTATASYYLSYRLLDGNGQAHPIYNGATGTLTNAGYTYRITNSTTLNPGFAAIDEDLASLRPITRLSPYTSYSVELRLFTIAGVETGDVATDGPRSYFHFTSVTTDDAAFNVIAAVDSVAVARRYAVNTDPDKNCFQVDVDYTLRRYDNFMGSHLPSDAIPVWLTVELRNVADNSLVGLVANVTNFNVLMFKHDATATEPVAPRVLSGTRRVNVIPANGVQLDSVNNQFRINVAIAHTEIPGTPPTVAPGNSVLTPAQQLLHFNGILRFGTVDTIFNSIDNDPTALSTVANSHVSTRLGVDGSSGSIVGHPTYTYGDGTDLAVLLRSDGRADFSVGAVTVDVPTGQPVKISNVQMELRPPTVLTPTGLRGVVRVTLPTGFGYRADTNGHFLNSRIDIGNVLLNDQLRPASDLTYSPGANFFCAEESKPIWIECNSLLWRVALGRFDLGLAGATPVHYVRQDEYASLAAAAPNLENSDKDLKRSNERYFGALTTIAAPATVTAAADCTARLSVNLGFGPGSYRAHFPYDAAVTWVGTGTMRVTEDNVISTGGESQLTRVGPVGVPYDTGCPGCDAGAPTRTAALVPNGSALIFTRDGGLMADGSMLPAHRLQWGWLSSLNDFAHESFSFTQGSLHIPGIFMRGDQVQLGAHLRANALLYTGVDPADANYLERPDTAASANQAAYEKGLADYAGINFVVGTDAAKQAESVIGGTPTGIYELKGNSKYYARQGGVSGIHDATSGSFPDELTIYGYQFQFANFGFNLLDSQMQDSLIRGAVVVPYPSGFDQRFDRLHLSCLGGVESGAIAADDVENHLVYWNNTFQSRSLDFRKNPDEACNATGGFLVLGIETHLPYVSQALIGSLGFYTNGDLIPKAEGVSDLDSRLALPSVVKIDGPPNEAYHVNPVANVYFNRWADHGVTEANLGTGDHGFGWVNIAASMDVPFFEDMNVHLQFSASDALPTPPVYVMGGWPTENNSDNHGWGTADANYFVSAYYDDVNRGFAEVSDIADYRRPNSDQFRPRAQRSWLRVIDFDYPLAWNEVLRRFNSPEPLDDDFLVLHTEHQAKTLSAQYAELTFGAQFDFAPVVNLANIMFNAIGDATGVSSALSDALGTINGDYYRNLTNGFRKLDQFLAPQLIDFYDPVFDARIDGRVATLYDKLAGDYAGAASFEDFLSSAVGNGKTIAQALEGAGDTIASRLNNLAGADPGSDGLMKELTNGLNLASLGVGSVNSLIVPDGGGNFSAGAELIKRLVDSFAPEFAANIVAGIAQEFLSAAGGSFSSLSTEMTGLGEYFAGLKGSVASVNGLGAEVRNRLNLPASGTEVGLLVGDVRGAVENYVQNLGNGIDLPFEDYTKDEFVRFVRREVEDRYHGTTITPAVQSILRQRLYDPDALLRQATDTAFQEINAVTRDLLSETASAIGGQFTEWLGNMKNLGASAKINGYGKINGDSLKEVRLDMEAKLEVMRPMELGAYVQIKELDSDGTPGCDHGAENVTEVSFGANVSGIRWLDSEASVSVDNKLTFGDGTLLGMAGSFNLEGNLGIGTFTVKQLAAAVAFGDTENYISGGGTIMLSKKLISGGLFVGRACRVDPIELWDPYAADVLGGSSFTGFYGYGELWISINELIGIPSSCLFDLSGGIGLGAGMFLEGPTAIGKIKYGVSGDLLCALSLKGELTGVGSLDLGALGDSVKDSLSLKAVGEFTAKLGYCPFCIPFHKAVSLTYQGGHWTFKK